MHKTKAQFWVMNEKLWRIEAPFYKREVQIYAMEVPLCEK